MITLKFVLNISASSNNFWEHCICVPPLFVADNWSMKMLRVRKPKIGDGRYSLDNWICDYHGLVTLIRIHASLTILILGTSIQPTF